MAYNSVLLHLDIDGPIRPRVAYAKSVALMFDADLIGFCAAEPRYVMRLGESNMAVADELKRQCEAIEASLAAAKAEFVRETENSKRASWRGLIGNPTKLLAINCRAADLIISGPQPDFPLDTSRSVDLGTLLLSSGRPVLLAPFDFQLPKAEAILIGWKDTREARRAIVDGLPFLTAASRVHVVTVDKNTPATRASIDDVVAYLARHGIKAFSEIVDVGGANEAEALMETASEFGADLIVSGAYGHSRLSEWAFGGVTRTLLRGKSVNRLLSN